MEIATGGWLEQTLGISCILSLTEGKIKPWIFWNHCFCESPKIKFREKDTRCTSPHQNEDLGSVTMLSLAAKHYIRKVLCTDSEIVYLSLWLLQPLGKDRPLRSHITATSHLLLQTNICLPMPKAKPVSRFFTN